MSENSALTQSPAARVVLSLLLPLLGALLFSLIVSRSVIVGGSNQGEAALQLAGVGVVSWIMGVRWYGLKGVGLRGGRPLYAGIGFATLGWLAFLLVRFAVVEIETFGSPNAGAAFVFILLFEAFCTQLWAFGFFFHSVADWRGPLTAAVAGGILFGAISYLFFQESFLSNDISLRYFEILYFMTWGVLYGIIRLRTGSFLGATIIQTMQSWTAWQILVPLVSPNVSQLRTLYLITTLIYLIIIWRLWPKREDDYRV
jgi:hypothetical protein